MQPKCHIYHPCQTQPSADVVTSSSLQKTTDFELPTTSTGMNEQTVKKIPSLPASFSYGRDHEGNASHINFVIKNLRDNTQDADNAWHSSTTHTSKTHSFFNKSILIPNTSNSDCNGSFLD